MFTGAVGDEVAVARDLLLPRCTGKVKARVRWRGKAGGDDGRGRSSGVAGGGRHTLMRHGNHVLN